MSPLPTEQPANAEPSTGLEPATIALQGRCSANLELQGRALGGIRGQGPGMLRVMPHRCTLGEIRTHTAQRLMLVPPAIGLRIGISTLLGHYPIIKTDTDNSAEPPLGVEPSNLSVRRIGGQPAQEAGCKCPASGAGLEPARARVRALLGTPTPHPESRTGGGIRTRMPRGLSSRGLHCRHSRVGVRRAGLEPATPGLRAQCSGLMS
jgi:hypothetical protein